MAYLGTNFNLFLYFDDYLWRNHASFYHFFLQLSLDKDIFCRKILGRL